MLKLHFKYHIIMEFLKCLTLYNYQCINTDCGLNIGDLESHSNACSEMESENELSG